MLALAAAVFTAALALIGKVTFDLWNRHRERRGIAGAIAGEIRAYVEILNPAVSSANYRDLAELDRERRLCCLRAFPALPTTHPVFDKVFDKIGSLPHEEAYGVSRIYNVVTGMRLVLSGMASQGFLEANDDLQKTRLILIASTIERDVAAARDLVERLQRVFRQSLWCFIGGCRP